MMYERSRILLFGNYFLFLNIVNIVIFVIVRHIILSYALSQRMSMSSEKHSFGIVFVAKSTIVENVTIVRGL